MPTGDGFVTITRFPSLEIPTTMSAVSVEKAPSRKYSAASHRMTEEEGGSRLGGRREEPGGGGSRSAAVRSTPIVITRSTAYIEKQAQIRSHRHREDQTTQQHLTTTTNVPRAAPRYHPHSRKEIPYDSLQLNPCPARSASTATQKGPASARRAISHDHSQARPLESRTSDRCCKDIYPSTCRSRFASHDSLAK